MHALLASFGDTATNPFALAFLAAGLLGSVAIGAGPTLRQFARELPARLAASRQGALEIAKDPSRTAASAGAIAQLPRAAIAYGLLGLLLAAWAAYAFTQPAAEMRPVQLEYVTSFGYVGKGPTSVALPDGVVGPVSAATVARTGGQPALYSAVLSEIDFGFNYEMRAPDRLEVLATGAAALRIRAQDGWDRTITLQSNQPLAGPKSTLLFTVNLDAVRLVIAGVETTTGAKSDWYDLTVVPVVRLAGQLGSAHIDETYSREFNLRYDRVHITPGADLDRTERRPGNTQVEARHHVHALGMSMELGAARQAAALGALVALGGAALLVMFRPKPDAGLPATSGTTPPRPSSKAAANPPDIPRAPRPAPADANPPPAAPPAPAAESAAPAGATTAAAAPSPPAAESAAPTSATTAPVTPSPPAAETAAPTSATTAPVTPSPPAADSAASGSATAPPVTPSHATPPAHTEMDDLLAASVAPSANGAQHPAAAPDPPRFLEPRPDEEPPSA